MQFPSLKHLIQSALYVFRRFPVEIVFALAGTIAAIAAIELNDTHAEAENWCVRIIMVCNLGLVLSISATLLAESRNWTGTKKTLLRGFPLFLSLLFLFLLNPDERPSDWNRFILLGLSFHLLVACIAFLGNKGMHTFWQFNKTIFLRFLTGALYSSVLFLGLSAAISAMNFLFNFNFEWDTFLILWVCIAGIFNTLFFLAGMPDFALLEQDNSYPKSLKIFTQYVLIPLASVYVVILLAYELKILIEWNLPKGLVANLILGYAVFGILSLLLIYPIRNLAENKWIKTYSKSFYFLLIPLLVLLFLAVGKRVFDYGVTENRYFIMMLAIWLCFITAYFLISRRQNIRLIPLSLSLFCLFAVYGPQSAFSVSRYAQEKELINIFKKQTAFADGKLLPLHKKIPKEDAVRVISTIQYLLKKNDLVSLQSLLQPNLQHISDSLSKIKSTYNPTSVSKWELLERKTEWLSSYLKLDIYADKELNTELAYNDPVKNVQAMNKEVIDVSGYDYVIEMPFAEDTLQLKYDNKQFRLIQLDEADDFSLKIDNDLFKFKASEIVKSMLSSEVLEMYNAPDDINSNRTEYKVPAMWLKLQEENLRYQVDFVIREITWRTTKNKPLVLIQVKGNYLIKKK